MRRKFAVPVLAIVVASILSALVAISGRRVQASPAAAPAVADESPMENEAAKQHLPDASDDDGLPGQIEPVLVGTGQTGWEPHARGT
jgi:hypothetical protein